jgi:beta-N-acetylhexosaminidase
VTASSTFSSAYDTFASNARDPELGELPGVCAHFLIDTDGSIHQLVSLRFRCRHTIGLNHRSIGIEHVARTDAELMGRPRQVRASLRLTRWLMARDGIAREHVIGHAESLSSPFYEERVKRLRGRTHGDMAPATMRRYRARL